MRIRPTVAAVDLDALRHNLGVAWGLVGPDCAVLAAVKGDAYGHGAVRCALALSSAPEPKERVDWFGVALVEEGAQLRAAGLSTPILCLGGVGRFGADEVVHLGLVPVDSADGHFVLEQARRYAEALKTLRARGYAPRLRHTCNSGGLVQYPTFHMDMVRPGLLLYGVAPSPETPRPDTPRLRPVLSVSTQVLVVRDLPARASVSYNRSFVTHRASRIATLPVGYADGYPRVLGGRAQVLIAGRRCPVVGVVCMDLCMVDVTDVPDWVEAGDEAMLLGAQGDARIGVEELAAWAETIPYEILCGFSERVPRV